MQVGSQMGPVVPSISWERLGGGRAVGHFPGYALVSVSLASVSLSLR